MLIIDRTVLVGSLRNKLVDESVAIKMGNAEAQKKIKATTQIAAKPVVKTWHKVIEFKGSSIKTTQKFNIDSNNWRIKWSTTPGSMGKMNFQIYVNDAKGDNIGVAANIIGKGSDESYMTDTGEHSLTINTAQNYTITIEQEK
ncbi:hypothetical protein [Clostridium estertheticum]|uniref:hypothetical protein n=1 Tax=Clostridium estertheticum TaxID=238834 RepID=UPI001C7D3685|nr:hypothetical protein [Clostridium estertheticum]MBX4271863.1 hypothetical protein [Clostridium estertheticum]WLC78298.1 hypothetical protein KTC98_13770 [Clostridium estertheticum]